MVLKKQNSRPNSPAGKRPTFSAGKHLAFFLPISLLLHLVLIVLIALLAPSQDTKKAKNYPSIVTFKAIPHAKPVAKDKSPKPDEATRILETPLAKTEAPQKPDFLGAEHHQAQRPQKLTKNKQVFSKNQDPGQKSGEKKAQKAQQKLAKSASPAMEKSPKSQKKPAKNLAGRHKNSPTPRNAYEQLLDQSDSLIQESVAGGYQDYIDQDLPEGDFIDLNTQEYRYIGYFTNMRKAIELAWNYPYSAAADGVYGKVGLVFTIQKDGSVSKVQVVNSSGYQVLDQTIVEAIKTAAPFAPLPAGFEKNNLNISGIFSYVLH
jgi:protein TonB